MKREGSWIAVVACASCLLVSFSRGRAFADEDYFSVGGMVLGPIAWKEASLTPFAGVVGAWYHPLSGCVRRGESAFGIGVHGFLSVGQATFEFEDVPGVEVEEESNFDVVGGVCFDVLFAASFGETTPDEKPSFFYLGAGVGGGGEYGSASRSVEMLGEEQTITQSWSSVFVLVSGFLGVKLGWADIRLELQAYPFSQNVTTAGMLGLSLAF